MKKIIAYACLYFLFHNASAQTYTPTAENLAARKQFQDIKFGMFIHWGPFSIPGDGEWVMNNRNITVKNYSRLKDFFNPIAFDAEKYVSLAKEAGMKYITLITRHHDGFSLWDTKASDFNIMNTPYKKDIVKMMADECHKQGIKLFLYYSLLDWRRDDYSYWTGRTGQGTGRTHHGNWNSYIQFMKDQLTELLTSYGEIGGIWFDGYWDQMPADDHKDAKTARPGVDWHMEEIYALIHKLQPQCLIGNNHHNLPLPGEDFQMFEKDLPGGNTTGFGGAAVSALPLETCETMNNSWGFNITDTSYKSVKTLIHYLVNDAGRNANFLLNIGPMPNGEIQPEFVDTLKALGAWIKQYGQSIYGTRGDIIEPQNWGLITAANKTLYVHITKPRQDYIFIPKLKAKVNKCIVMGSGTTVKFKQQPEGVFVYTTGLAFNDVDTILQMEVSEP
jgi:alpha-L-fucosidase